MLHDHKPTGFCQPLISFSDPLATLQLYILRHLGLLFPLLMHQVTNSTLRNLVCVWIARRGKILHSFLLSQFCPQWNYISSSNKLPAPLQRKAWGPTERQDLETLHTKKSRCYNPKLPAITMSSEWPAFGSICFVQKKYSNPGQNCWVYCKREKFSGFYCTGRQCRWQEKLMPSI